MWFFVASLIQISLSLISAAIAQARAKKAVKAANSSPGEIQAPIAEHGTPIGVVYGTTKIKGPNVIGKFGTQWVQSNGIYDYYANLQLALCWGSDDAPVELKSIYLSDATKASMEPLLKWAPSASWNPVASTIDLGITWVESQGSNMAASIASGSVVAGDPSIEAGEPSRGVINTSAYSSMDQWFADVGSNETLYPTGTMVVSYGNGDTRNNSNAPTFGVILSDPTYGRYIATGTIKAGTIAYAVTSGTNLPNHNTVIPAGWIRYDGTFWRAYEPVIPPETKLPKWSETYCVTNPYDTAGVKVNGDIRFYPGRSDQGVDPFLLDSNGKGPRFPGLCHIVFASGDKRSKFKSTWFYWGQSPQLPQLAYEVARFPDPLGLGAAAKINTYDANPANIVYDLISSMDYGLRIPETKIDKAAFIACGQKLSEEGLGMSLLFDKSASFDSIQDDICKTVDANLYQDPQTGLWTMALTRQDYDVETLPVFGPDDYVAAPEYVRNLDTANQVEVTFCSRSAGYVNRSVRWDDACGYQAAGGIRTTISISYNGVTQDSTAYKLANRDGQVYSQPIAKNTIKLNRRGWKLRPGSPFVLNDPEEGIVGMVCRVGTINYGTLENPVVAVDALEDVFGVPLTTYVPPADVPPETDNQLPQQPVASALWEVPYPMGGKDPSIQVAALAAPGDHATSMQIWTDDTVTGTFSNTGVIPSESDGYTPSGLLSAALANTEERTESVTLQGLVGLDSYDLIGGNESGKNLLLVGDEVMSFGLLAYNDDETITLHDVLRGVFDTIPRAHAIGERAWFVRDLSMVNAPYTSNGTHHAKVVAGNRMGTIQQASVPAQSITTGGRQVRPYTAGKFRVAATTLAETLTDGRVIGVESGIAVSWEPRNRLSQSGAVPQDATGIAVEDSAYSQICIGRLGSSNAGYGDGVFAGNVIPPSEIAMRCNPTTNGWQIGVRTFRGAEAALFDRWSGTFEPCGYGIGYGRYYGGPEN